MRVLEVNNPSDLEKIMQDIHVDKHGIDIMSPKALTYLVKINKISNICANILKQEMLSLGGDSAIARDALTGKAKRTDCLLIGNLSQFNRLNDKLRMQPFGLDRLSQELNSTLENYKREVFLLDLGRYKLKLGVRKFIMGIVNLTPDSFSGDGLYAPYVMPRALDINKIIELVEKMVEDGADIIDVGGESSRPGAKPISIKEELERTMPVIKKLARKIEVPISIDTYKPEVARQALDCGASIVNDITGLRNKKMARIVAKYKGGVVIMHMKGRPQTMQRNPIYKSLIDEIIEYLDKAINTALDCGIDKERIIVDPGIGFGKTLEHNLVILKSLKEFKVLGCPILVGPSRKSFIARILNEPPEPEWNKFLRGASASRGYASQSSNIRDKRISGTLASSVLCALNGADILRVHDVAEVKQALKIIDAIISV